LPRGTGIGFAIDDRKSVAPRGIALVAMGVTVSVSPSGSVTIERMDIVHDQGHAIVNPEAAERQIRGMMAWSLGPVFNQEISFRNGGVEQTNPPADHNQLHENGSLDFWHRRGGGTACRASDLKRDPDGDRQTYTLDPPA
jgi:hypothetical protein